MGKSLEKLLNSFDRFSEITGKAVSWLIVVIIAIMSYETIVRYFFNSPTIWAYDLVCMLFGTYIMIGAAYVSKEKQHVKVEVFYEMFSPKVKLIADIAFDIILFFPLTIIIFIYSLKYAALSWQMNEKSWQSVWYPPLYPFKTVMPVAFLLLIIQGCADFIRNILAVIKEK